jgi:hypothetical protein
MQFGVLAEPLLDGKRLEQMARHGNLVHALPSADRNRRAGPTGRHDLARLAGRPLISAYSRHNRCTNPLPLNRGLQSVAADPEVDRILGRPHDLAYVGQ